MTGVVLRGVLIPFLGTSLGAAMVFFLKKQISGNPQKILTVFAVGVQLKDLPDDWKCPRCKRTKEKFKAL